MKENNNFNNFNDSLKILEIKKCVALTFSIFWRNKRSKRFLNPVKLSFKSKDDCLFLIAIKFYKMQTNERKKKKADQWLPENWGGGKAVKHWGNRKLLKVMWECLLPSFINIDSIYYGVGPKIHLGFFVRPYRKIWVSFWPTQYANLMEYTFTHA